MSRASGACPAPGRTLARDTALTWTSPRFTRLTPLCWFAGYAYDARNVGFRLIPHPYQGAEFADDQEPGETDPIPDLGALGFGNDPGYLPCPDTPGACCLPDGTCQLLAHADCRGRWVGSSVAFDQSLRVGRCGLRSHPRGLNHYVVSVDGDGQLPTIQAAVNTAALGATIELADGTFRGAGNRDVDFNGKDLIIRSQSGNADPTPRSSGEVPRAVPVSVCTEDDAFAAREAGRRADRAIAGTAAH